VLAPRFQDVHCSAPVAVQSVAAQPMLVAHVSLKKPASAASSELIGEMNPFSLTRQKHRCNESRASSSTKGALLSFAPFLFARHLFAQLSWS